VLGCCSGRLRQTGAPSEATAAPHCRFAKGSTPVCRTNATPSQTCNHEEEEEEEEDEEEEEEEEEEPLAAFFSAFLAAD